MNLKNRVMARIYIEHSKALLWRNLSLLASLFIVTYLSVCISMPNVLHNMPKESLHSMLTFYLSAFKNTEMFIKVVIVSFLVSVTLSVYKLLKSYREYLPLQSHI